LKKCPLFIPSKDEILVQKKPISLHEKKTGWCKWALTFCVDIHTELTSGYASVFWTYIWNNRHKSNCRKFLKQACPCEKLRECAPWSQSSPFSIVSAWSDLGHVTTLFWQGSVILHGHKQSVYAEAIIFWRWWTCQWVIIAKTINNFNKLFVISLLVICEVAILIVVLLPVLLITP